MDKCRAVLVIFLTAGLIGCQTPPSTITDYRPQGRPVMKKAPDAQVYVLWRSCPVVPVEGGDAVGPNYTVGRQHQVEVVQVYMPRGAPVGFRRQNGQLLAVGGGTIKPLEDASYAWKTLPGTSQKSQNSARAADNFAMGFFAAVVVVILLPISWCFPDPDDDNCEPFGSGGSNVKQSHRNPSRHKSPAGPPSKKRASQSSPG
jgi:hypothetical protein